MLEEHEFPGSILVRLGLGTIETYAENKSKWKEDTQGLLKRESYELRVHIYQVSLPLGWKKRLLVLSNWLVGSLGR